MGAQLWTRGWPTGSFPLLRVKVRLRLREPLTFPFVHGGLLRTLLRRALGAEKTEGLHPLALESGHVRYAAGDVYDFVVSAPPGCSWLVDELGPALAALGAGRGWGARPLTLDGNFDLEGVEVLPLPSLAENLGRAELLAARGRVRLIFPSPLRLRCREMLPQPGQSLLGGESFPVAGFLDQLWQRCASLLDAADRPALPAGFAVRQLDLFRLDLPGGRFPLGGFCGSLLIENLPLPWLRLLVALEGCHLGDAADFGFGAFFLDALPSWLRPARTYEDEFLHEDGSPAAAAKLLAPAALALLDEGAAFFRLGLSRSSADEGLRRARQNGLNGSVGGAGKRFVAGLSVEDVLRRLHLFWPAEPLHERFRAWLRQPEARDELARLLGKLFAVELAAALAAEGRLLVRVGGELRVLGREAARVA